MVLQKAQTPVSNRIYFIIVTFLLVSVLVYNLVNLQIVKGRQYFFDSKNSASFQSVVRANRGIIYDRNGNKLVENLTKYNLNVLKKEHINSDKFDKTIQSLSKLFNEDVSIKYNSEFEKIKDIENIPYAKIFSKLDYHPYIFQIEAHLDDYPALKLEKIIVRNYLYPDLISHIVGYTGDISAEDYKTGAYYYGDEIGKFGVEKGYDDILRGKNGLERIDYYATDNQKVNSLIQEKVNGQDVYLTIDITYQQKLYEIIKKALEIESLKNSTSVSTVLQDVKTGNILAMASYPTFDSNLFAAGINQSDYKKYLDDPGKPLTNKATQFAQSPGSIFKPLTDMVALQEGAITSDTRFYTGGTWDYGGVTFQDNDRHNWGDIGVEYALCISSNIFHMKTALALDEKSNGKGAELIKKTFSDIGMDSTSNLKIGSEAVGYFPIPKDKEDQGEPWLPGYLLNASIGQGDVRITPLEAANLVSTIASRGEIRRQNIILDKNDPKKSESKRLNIDPKQFDTINEGMKCSSNQLNGLTKYDPTKYSTVSGKTGTAETGQIDKDGNEVIHAWQITFTPSEDPELAMSIFIENGKQGYNGDYISKEFYKVWNDELRVKK